MHLIERVHSSINCCVSRKLYLVFFLGCEKVGEKGFDGAEHSEIALAVTVIGGLFGALLGKFRSSTAIPQNGVQLLTDNDDDLYDDEENGLQNGAAASATANFQEIHDKSEEKEDNQINQLKEMTEETSEGEELLIDI